MLEQAIESDMEIVAHPSNEVPYSYHFKDQIKSIEHAEDIVQQPLEYLLDTVKLNEVVELYAANPNSALSPTITVYYNIYRLLTEENILENPAISMMNPMIKMT
ncbi:MAG: amidohydrolase, partial [Cyclobacteriaceae bacterium]